MSDSQITIVLAEDNPGDAYLVRLALEQTGLNFQLLELTDGEHAMRYLDELDADHDSLCPAFLLLDLNLPRFDGKSVLGRLKTIKKCALTRTIVLTSSQYPVDRADVERMGANRYFHKPQDLESFMKLGDLIVEMISAKGSTAVNTG